MNFIRITAALAALVTAGAADLEARFSRDVKPFLQKFCLDCHDTDVKKAELDLSIYPTLDSVTKDFGHWELVTERLQAGDMPPAKSKTQPTPQERKAMIDWIAAVRKFEADRNAGDPGPVLARRLSNAEYDNSIRDLTGQNIRPTREFPVDPANQAGFDNTGESLTMSPALLKKYLAAAKEVSDHVLLKPDGLDFAPHLVLVDTDRDKYCILRIVDFYQRQPTDLADYFEAAWKQKKGKPVGNVSAKYLRTISHALNGKEEVGPIAKLQEMFKASNGERAKFIEMRDFVVSLRAKIVPEVENLRAPQINPSAQALVLWKDRTWAANRTKYDPTALQIDGVVQQAVEEKDKPASYNQRKVKKKSREADPNLFVPSAERAKYEGAFARFAEIFPDAFYVKERARAFVDPEEEKANGNVGRLLSAGLHNMTGYFRDDGPLYDMILDEKGQRELDRLWDEFNMIAQVPQRMHQSTVYFERTDSRFLSDAEFDFARAEDKDVTSEAKVKKLAELYYAKAERLGASEKALGAIKEHFERVWADISHYEKMARDAEALHLKSLVAIAERAYRRPLTRAEGDGLLAFYKNCREQDGLTHEEAIRDSVASVLMSPNFLYRVDLVPGSKPIQPLDDFALASRLSYFLWSSVPDRELLDAAARGDLRKPKTLVAQARRMMKNEKARALATEFLGNWLDFRRFEEHNSVDRERFPQFDNDLRAAMFEEPARFFLDVAQENRSVLDFLYAKRTFVNPTLAKHYGIPGVTNGWTRIDDATAYGRGGLLPMSVFMTKNAPGLRTSPVKRGYWVVRRVLGERIPPPPPTVPELPADESKTETSLREALAQHRDNSACAGCHNRFDSYGLVFEGFGPIGERRTLDLAGRPVETRAEIGDGVEGLRAFIRKNREDDFVENLCRQFLAYGLGRTLIVSDDSTIREMKSKLAASNYRFGALVESVVTSPQFLNKRGQQAVASK